MHNGVGKTSAARIYSNPAKCRKQESRKIMKDIHKPNYIIYLDCTWLCQVQHSSSFVTKLQEVPMGCHRASVTVGDGKRKPFLTSSTAKRECSTTQETQLIREEKQQRHRKSRHEATVAQSCPSLSLSLLISKGKNGCSTRLSSAGNKANYGTAGPSRMLSMRLVCRHGEPHQQN